MRVVNALVKLAGVNSFDVDSISTQYQLLLLAARLPYPPERTVVRVVNALVKLASEQLVYPSNVAELTWTPYGLHITNPVF